MHRTFYTRDLSSMGRWVVCLRHKWLRGANQFVDSARCTGMVFWVQWAHRCTENPRLQREYVCGDPWASTQDLFGDLEASVGRQDADYHHVSLVPSSPASALLGWRSDIWWLSSHWFPCRITSVHKLVESLKSHYIAVFLTIFAVVWFTHVIAPSPATASAHTHVHL